MKALLQRAYGTTETLAIGEIETPSPGAGEVLVRVHAASINAGDWFVMTGKPYITRLAFGIRRPRVPIRGRDVAGVVEALGEGVTRFAVGDRVFGECASGSLAEFASVPERFLAAAPERLPLDQVAAAPVAGVTAMTALTETVVVREGDRVLVNGASGGVGTFAVQLAAALGAEVTAVCSARNAEQAAALGAHRVIDYATTDFTAEAHRYDVVLDLAGNHSLRALRSVLARRGTLALSSGAGGVVLGPIGRLLRAAVYSLFVTQRLSPVFSSSTAVRLQRLAGFIDSGAMTPTVEARFAFDEAVAAFERYGRAGARSKIVVTISK